MRFNRGNNMLLRTCTALDVCAEFVLPALPARTTIYHSFQSLCFRVEDLTRLFSSRYHVRLYVIFPARVRDAKSDL